MTTLHKTAIIDGLSVFYRESGKPDAPKLVLLGGFPASSHQFRNLIPALANRFHVISPDYPGFGNTEMPDPKTSRTPSTGSRKSSKGSLRRPDSCTPDSSCRTTVAPSASASSGVAPSGWSG